MNTAETVTAIEKNYKLYHFSLIGVLVTLMIGLALGFANRTVSAIVALLGLLLFFAVTRPAKKAYVKGMTESNILLTVGRKIGARTVEAKNVTVISSEIVKNAELIPVDADLAKPYFVWGISGEDAGYRTALCDISLAQKIPDAPRTKSANFTPGVWTHIDLPFDTGRDYRLIDPRLLPEEILNPFLNASGLIKNTARAESGKVEFIFAQKDGREIPGSAAIKRLDDLAAYTSGITAFSLRGRSLDVFIENRFLSAEVSARVQPTAKMLEFNPFPELNRILELAMSLRQDL